MNQSKYEALLKTASEKLGTSPEKLRGALERGDISALSSSLTREDKEKLRSVLANKALMEKLRSAASPEDIVRILTRNK